MRFQHEIENYGCFTFNGTALQKEYEKTRVFFADKALFSKSRPLIIKMRKQPLANVVKIPSQRCGVLWVRFILSNIGRL